MVAPLRYLSLVTSVSAFFVANRQINNNNNNNKPSSDLYSTAVQDRTTAPIDLNVYNLESLEQIVDEWTAIVRPENAMQDAGISLEAKTNKEYTADIVALSFQRSSSALGLDLLELAGGREDGRGIVIVNDVMPGGAADGSGILPGDSVIQVSVVSKTSTSTNRVAVDTECLDWDGTVAALQSLPDYQDNQSIILSVKRLRRRPKVQLTLEYSPDEKKTIQLFAGENLRRAMLARNVKLNDALARRFDSGGTGDCGAEGTCCTCAVAVRNGTHLLSEAKTQEEQMLKNKPNWRLACKAIVGAGMQEGELTIRVNPRQW